MEVQVTTLEEALAQRAIDKANAEADLKSAVQAARSVAALVPPVRYVQMLSTVPGSSHAARRVFLNASVAAWQTAAMAHVNLMNFSDTDDCRIDRESCEKAVQSERGLQHLEEMTQHSGWMIFELSQDAIDSMDGDGPGC
jgi:hypothetical protein